MVDRTNCKAGNDAAARDTMSCLPEFELPVVPCDVLEPCQLMKHVAAFTDKNCSNYSGEVWTMKSHH